MPRSSWLHWPSELKKSPLSSSMKKAREQRVAKLMDLKTAARQELDGALANDSTPMHSAHVPTAVRKLMGDADVLVVDGGNTAVWTQFYFDMREPGTLLATFKLGMLGAGVGQALGAQVAHPDRKVVCVLGDGAMGFHMQEVETAVRNKLPITFVVLCDKQWGMVKLTQQFAMSDVRSVIGSKDEGTINADFGETHFDKLAEAMGAKGARVSSPKELEATLRDAIESPEPAVVHVDVDPMLHLWAPGLQTFKEMHQEPAG